MALEAAKYKGILFHYTLFLARTQSKDSVLKWVSLKQGLLLDCGVAIMVYSTRCKTCLIRILSQLIPALEIEARLHDRLIPLKFSSRSEFTSFFTQKNLLLVY
jgi:hypothetical protein